MREMRWEMEKSSSEVEGWEISLRAMTPEQGESWGTLLQV